MRLTNMIIAMKHSILTLAFSFLSIVTFAQVDSVELLQRKIELPSSKESFAEKMDRLNIDPRKYQLHEVCYTDGLNIDCKEGHKRLSKMINYFDRINNKTRSSNNQIGTWFYDVIIMDENTIMVYGNKAVAMQISKKYEFKRY
jgi:hypothetical protein